MYDEVFFCLYSKQNYFNLVQDIESMENELCQVLSQNASSKSVHESDILRIINEFVRNPLLKEGSILKR